MNDVLEEIAKAGIELLTGLFDGDGRSSGGAGSRAARRAGRRRWWAPWTRHRRALPPVHHTPAANQHFRQGMAELLADKDRKDRSRRPGRTR